MVRKSKKNKKKFSFNNISPDEIFLDSENVSNFDYGQFEGRMEKPIKFSSFLFLGLVFLLIGLSLFGRTFFLQVVKGDSFKSRADNNHLRMLSLVPDRGLVYDRNNELLVWNNSAYALVMGKEVFDNEKLSSELNNFLDFIEQEKEGGGVYNLEKGDSQDLFLGVFSDFSKVNDIILRWSHLPLRIESVPLRMYKDSAGLSHLLGYIGLPSSDDIRPGLIAMNDIIGKAGVEKSYEDVLRGEKGYKLIEVDSLSNIKSESIQKKTVSGEDIKLSVDFKLQDQFYKILLDTVEERGFNGAAGVIVDVDSGEILTMVSYPEYSSQVLSDGKDKEKINSFIQNDKKPFLNRAISGLYAPGSIVKPFMAIAALNEGTIDPNKKIFSSGSISIPNPYFPEKETVFRDWKAHGWVDMKEAIAVSSDVYFYSIGGGFEDVKGLGIGKIGDYMKLFGMGQSTGIILDGEAEGLVPSPESRSDKKTGEESVWRIGDTYHVSIGQGDFQVTPIQMALSTAMVANNGSVIKPTIVLGETSGATGESINIPVEYFEIVKEGMREAVLSGTAHALSGLPVSFAAKTGTAELGVAKNFVNSWLVGFWPYEKPRFAISVVMEKGSSSNLIGGVYVVNELIKWMAKNTPEYLSSIDDLE
ncbi:MAG: hypothetical protein K9M15_02615 [Candidatus Marinimicrobia bacterium]|nr:hypothetical protein [Candidatus Neomarinimicrobiota bacterium]